MGGEGSGVEEASITEQALREFGRDEFQSPASTTHNVPMGPVFVRNFSLRKDPKAGGGGDDLASAGLKTAPNFASAILSPWLAAKLGLDNAPPTRRPADGDADVASSSSSPSSSQYVFQNVNAVLRPQEGTLLLGPSSSGKTTFMRSLGDVLGGTPLDHAEGEVTLGPTRWDPTKCPSNLKRTVAYVDQSDLTLTPILTVEETVRFARSCAEELDPDVLERSMDAIFKLAGLDHVRRTVVGNADIRGVSGGQKRRVKMLEMAVGTDVTVMFLDEITNGLDAASALSICKVVRAALEAQHFSAITCLLQPSDDVYRTFHRVILLTPDGQVAYSGRTEDAIGHFEGLGLRRPDDMNVPEFLLRCASSPADLLDEEEKINDPRTPSDLVEAFVDSLAGKAVVAELDDKGDERAAFGQDGNVPALKDFAQPTSRQIRLLLGRGWKLVKRNPATIMRLVSAIIFGVFIGTLFLNTPSDEAGTSVRGGYVLTLIFLSFLNSCMAPLDELYADRLTFYIHRKASFYRTVSYYVSQILCSWPVAVGEAFLLSVLSFFAVGMSNNGGWAFFYFWLQFTLTTMSGTAVSRCLAYSLPTADMAQSLGPAVLLLFILSACYSPQYMELPSWLRWLAWISPCAYCYEGVIVTETAWRTVGQTNGQEYAQQDFGIPRPSPISTPGGVIAFDACILVVLTVVFEILGCVLLHKSQEWYGPSSLRYQVASGQSLRSPPWKNKGINKKSSEAEAWSAIYMDRSNLEEDSTGVPEAPPAHLTAKEIVYEVDVEIDRAKEAKTEVAGEEEGHLHPLIGDDSASDHSPSGATIVGYNADDDSSVGTLMTAREYGQQGKGALAELMLTRQLGERALRSTSTISSANISSSMDEYMQRQTLLSAPAPGRLRLLSGITASFEPGTLNALMGESGAGKTTLLDAIAGYKTDGHLTGDINVNGVPKDDGIWRSIAGYCEQTDLHNPSMTVRESLIFAARMRLRPFSLDDIKKVAFATKIMTLLELDEFADMLVGDEASGEGLPKHARKRLTVGVELAANPSILFADEPTSGLDSLSAAMVVSSLKKAAKVQGLTVVCTIHQPSREVFLAFDKLLLLKKGGRCVYNGPIADLEGYISAGRGSLGSRHENDVNPADYALDVFCGPLGVGTDWVKLYNESGMCERIMNAVQNPSGAGEISIDQTPQSFASELYLVLQRQIIAHWRTTTYMALRFWWTIIACVIVGLVYFGSGTDGDVTKTVSALFFYVNIATVPLLSAMVPLITERAVFYRETLSGTYSKYCYGTAVQLAEIPFNLGFALVSFVIFYFMVGLSLEVERIFYFILMALASYWVLPAFGQLLAFVSPNVGAAVGAGSLLMTLFTLTMGFLIIPKDIPPWYIWIYWMNPLRYMLQGFVVSEIGGKDANDEVLASNFSWSYDDRWWYCYVVTVMFGAFSFLGIIYSTRISWLKR